jgi:hypothetical protein
VGERERERERERENHQVFKMSPKDGGKNPNWRLMGKMVERSKSLSHKKT